MDVTRIKELRDREGMTQKDVAEMNRGVAEHI